MLSQGAPLLKGSGLLHQPAALEAEVHYLELWPIRETTQVSYPTLVEQHFIEQVLAKLNAKLK